MTKFVFTYSGGRGMPETEEEQARVMQEWSSWFEQLGDSVVDGGNPFAQARTIGPDGSVSEAGTLGGYSVISADSIDDAVARAKGCPILGEGGSVEVNEAIEM